MWLAMCHLNNEEDMETNPINPQELIIWLQHNKAQQKYVHMISMA